MSNKTKPSPTQTEDLTAGIIFIESCSMDSEEAARAYLPGLRSEDQEEREEAAGNAMYDHHDVIYELLLLLATK